jgi:hypothetical protein
VTTVIEVTSPPLDPEFYAPSLMASWATSAFITQDTPPRLVMANDANSEKRVHELLNDLLIASVLARGLR